MVSRMTLDKFNESFRRACMFQRLFLALVLVVVRNSSTDGSFNVDNSMIVLSIPSPGRSALEAACRLDISFGGNYKPYSPCGSTWLFCLYTAYHSSRKELCETHLHRFGIVSEGSLSWHNPSLLFMRFHLPLTFIAPLQLLTISPPSDVLINK